MEGLFLEHNSLKRIGAPADIAAGLVGARVGMKNVAKCAIVIEFGAGGSVVEATLKQHTALSGGSSKNLDVKANYYYKQSGATVFTKVEKRVDDASLSAVINLDSEIGANAGTLVIEVEDSHLDVNADYNHISVDLTAAGGAKIAGGHYILREVDHKPGYALVVD